MKYGDPLDNRRPQAIFCRQRCERRYYRAGTSGQASNYLEPPPAGTPAFADARADARFRQHSQARVPGLNPSLPTSKPFSTASGATRADCCQNSNSGYCRQRELAEDQARALKVEDRFDQSTRGSVAPRAIPSRAANRHLAADTHVALLRPGQPGPLPRDDYVSAWAARMPDAAPQSMDYLSSESGRHAEALLSHRSTLPLNSSAVTSRSSSASRASSGVSFPRR